MENTSEEGATSGLRWQTVLLVGLSLSIGWGIRGNFGHEIGAMLPGALSAMAVALLSNREDWQRRVAYFGMFGAIGWAFGGSISYMQVIGYTHSGHSLSVWYGFACLFLIGFVWAAAGGAATALPAYLSRERLLEFFPPLITILLTWWAWDIYDLRRSALINGDYRQNDPLYWYDTDWLATLLAMVAVLALAAIRRRLDRASLLVLYMTVGWWAGFLILVIGLDWRMTPPRGDNWAGSVGMVIGMWVYFQRQRLYGMTFASLVTGFIGGLGFATATLFKLIEMKSGLDTNWHSILEQTYGFINGIGVAVAMGLLMARAPRQSDDPPTQRWTEGFAVAFLLLLVTYLNFQQDPEAWIKAKAIPATMYFFPTLVWFNLAYIGIALTVLYLLREHLRRPLPIVPATWLGKGQLLYLTFLWWVVLGNFAKAVVSFAPQRLVTEGTIHVNALICTLMVLLCVRTPRRIPIQPLASYGLWLKKALLIGTVGMALSTMVDWGLVRALYGDTFAGGGKLHIRFGPRATATKEKPKPGQPHP